MTEPEALLRLTGIRKRYGGVQALRGVDFDVRSGEVHALVGENGAGKSTLIKIISGAETADEGTVEMTGQRLGG
ncbi:MAG: ATP-binding cassette domain-containing protein, partial [Actinomycetes bacterium]